MCYSLSFVCYLLFRNESSKEWSINIIVKSWVYKDLDERFRYSLLFRGEKGGYIREKYW